MNVLHMCMRRTACFAIHTKLTAIGVLNLHRCVLNLLRCVLMITPIEVQHASMEVQHASTKA